MHIIAKKSILAFEYILLIEGKIMTFRHHFLFLSFVFFLLNSCGGMTEELSSTDTSEEEQASVSSDPSVNEERFYTITNDFQNHKNANPVYIQLSSINTGESYVIPPTKYKPVELKYVIIDIKVEGECVKIPEKAFPVSVGVCESSGCTSVRSLSVILKNPAHYNISGIGGLLTPQINPVSPCSKEYIDLIGSVEDDQTL